MEVSPDGMAKEGSKRGHGVENPPHPRPSDPSPEKNGCRKKKKPQKRVPLSGEWGQRTHGEGKTAVECEPSYLEQQETSG